MPKVTVSIPTYNAGRFLEFAVASVLRQEGFDDYEILICDDASTDETERLCRERLALLPKVRYFRFDHGGQSVTWNRAVSVAAGEYVILLHGDDALSPAYLKNAVEVLDRHADVGLVHCAVQHIDAANRPLAVSRPHDVDRIERGDAVLRRLLLDGCVVNPAGVLVRRSAYDRVGGFTDEIVWGVDWHMWARIVLAYDVAYLAQPLSLYREHHGSGTSAVMKTARYVNDELWLLRDLFRLIPASRGDLHALRAEAIRRVAHRAWCHSEDVCRRGDGRGARTGLRSAAQVDPRLLRQARFWALWTATVLGYRWFRLARSVKAAITRSNGAR